MVDYARAEATAQRLIGKNGKTVWLIVRTRTGGTERNPIYTDQEHPLKAVELNQRLKNLDGSLAPGTIHALLVSTEGLNGLAIRNDNQFRLIAGGAKIGIAEARPLVPGDRVILWEVDLAG